MTREELQKLLADLPKARVAVIGDYCLDAYWFIDRSREEVSLETGLTTWPVRRQRYSLGGAGNVVMNLLAMGVRQVQAFGVIGNDPFGQEMLKLLTAGGVDVRGMLTQNREWSTHIYAKPYKDDKEMSRIDFGNYNELSEETAADLLARLEKAVDGVDVAIVNEQVASGIHNTAFFRDKLAALIGRHSGKVFILDSRQYSNAYPGVVRKINDHEAARLCGIQREPDDIVLYEEAVKAAETLGRKFRKPVFVTRGPRGCLVFDDKGLREVPGLLIMGRTDTVGAGDSMLAGIAGALAVGRDHLMAATLGNFVAGVTVQKLFQTGTASPDEILAIGADPNYVYRPELADDPRQARVAPGTEFEIVTDVPHGNRFSHAIFDHDGTISTLRQGWERIMEPVMIQAILGEKFQAADESLYQKVVQRVRDYIDKTTGVQTLVQMEGLVDIVREFGLVPRDCILDAPGYKRIYNDGLMNLVRERVAKFERGELNVDDYTMKNGVKFLQLLRQAGVRLFLASGTDEQDVINEAKALGYADVFDGRIYGAVGRTDVEAKKVVMERILNDIGQGKAGNVIVFGDGPVEIRETHKRGGYAVGIASDEIRRFGLNRDKRARLIRAGSDLIIPDFSQLNNLLKILGLPG